MPAVDRRPNERCYTTPCAVECHIRRRAALIRIATTTGVPSLPNSTPTPPSGVSSCSRTFALNVWVQDYEGAGRVPERQRVFGYHSRLRGRLADPSYRYCLSKLLRPWSPYPLHAGTIQGSSGSPYEGGMFIVDIVVPASYPFEPPKMKFDTKIWHPNVSSQTGAICLVRAAVESSTGAHTHSSDHSNCSCRISSKTSGPRR